MAARCTGDGTVNPERFRPLTTASWGEREDATGDGCQGCQGWISRSGGGGRDAGARGRSWAEAARTGSWRSANVRSSSSVTSSDLTLSLALGIDGRVRLARLE